VGRVIALALSCVYLLSPALDRHDGRDLGAPRERPTEIAVAAVHGSLAAHLDAAGRRVERQCSACLLQSRTVASTGRPLPTLERPPALGRRAPADPSGVVAAERRRQRSRAPPRLA
jgi:hypothetical protein